MVLAISQNDLKSLLNMEDCIQAVEDGFIQLSLGNVIMPPRTEGKVNDYKGLFLVMPAYIGKIDKIGLKMVTVYRENPSKHNLPTIMGTVLLADAKTGNLLAIMDGTYLTAIRTGAASGVATKHLARKDAKSVGIFGCGIQAKTQLIAICTVRNIQNAMVYDVLADQSKKYAIEMSKSLGINVQTVDSPIDAVKGSDVISTATTSTQPIFQGKWLEEGTHVNGVGSHSTTTRELDTFAINRSKVVVDSLDACLREAGDIVIPILEKSIEESHVYAEIGEIVSGKKIGRSNDNEITLFKSVGLAVQDISTANVVYELAKKNGVGKELTL